LTLQISKLCCHTIYFSVLLPRNREKLQKISARIVGVPFEIRIGYLLNWVIWVQVQKTFWYINHIYTYNSDFLHVLYHWENLCKCISDICYEERNTVYGWPEKFVLVVIGTVINEISLFFNSVDSWQLTVDFLVFYSDHH
jgi:hypothetical protein